MTPLSLRLFKSRLKAALYPSPKTSILNDSNSKVSIPGVHSLIYSSILLAPPKMSSSVSRTSSFQRLLESPFSHSDMYGTQHHTYITSSKKPRRRSSSVKLKNKTRVLSQRTLVKSSGHKPRKSRHDKVTSLSGHKLSTASKVTTPSGHKLSTTSTHTSTRQSSLVQVDYDSPNTTRQTKLLPIQSCSTTGAPPLQSHTLSGTAPRSNDLSTNRFLLKLITPPTNQSPTRSAINIRLSHTSASSGPSKPLSFRRDYSRGFKNDDTFTIEDLAKGLAKMQYKKIIVMSGAGISTASGIPDFRTPGTGLYDNLKQYRIPEPSAIFDITFFFHNPRPFFTLAKDLYPGKYSPNIVHYFIRLLQEKGHLLRTYTQNIDGLERLAGIKTARLVEAHGSFSTASCTVCHARHDADEVKSTIFKDRLPRCKHKFCSGVVKPDIVFFGEDLPRRFHSLRHMDFAQCDLLFIMGTSLEVEPFASLATMTKFDVPRILINREVVGPFKYQRRRTKDVIMSGDLVEQVSKLVTLAGWQEELQDLMKEKGVESTVENNVIETAGEQNGLSIADTGGVFDQTTPTRPDVATPASSSENNVTTDDLTESLGQLKLSDKKK